MSKENIITYVDSIASKHYSWIDAMNWHNKTHLENLALIFSEIGEAIVELNGKNHEKLSEECADIVLRLIDFSYGNKFNLLKIPKTTSKEVNFDNIIVEISNICNVVRYENINFENFEKDTLSALGKVIDLSLNHHVDLIGFIDYKMNKNLKKGNKGRIT